MPRQSTHRWCGSCQRIAGSESSNAGSRAKGDQEKSLGDIHPPRDFYFMQWIEQHQRQDEKSDASDQALYPE
jgi:hypothetical protein